MGGDYYKDQSLFYIKEDWDFFFEFTDSWAINVFNISICSNCSHDLSLDRDSSDLMWHELERSDQEQLTTHSFILPSDNLPGDNYRCLPIVSHYVTIKHIP